MTGHEPVQIQKSQVNFRMEPWLVTAADVGVLPILIKVLKCWCAAAVHAEEEMHRYRPTKNFLSNRTAQDYSALENNILELNLKDWLLDIQVNCSVWNDMNFRPFLGSQNWHWCMARMCEQFYGPVRASTGSDWETGTNVTAWMQCLQSV